VKMFKFKNFFLIALIALCLSCSTVQANFGKVLRYAKAPNGEDIICVYRFGVVQNCYPKVFQPTENYKTILEGQDIPPGLDIQLSLATGERRAKLSDAQIRARRLANQFPQERYYQPQYYLRQYPRYVYNSAQQQQQQQAYQQRQYQQQMNAQQQYLHYLQQQQLRKQREAEEAKEQYIQYLRKQQQQREAQEVQRQYLQYLQHQKQQEAEEAQQQYLRYLQQREKIRALEEQMQSQKDQEKSKEQQEAQEHLIEEVLKEDELNGQSNAIDEPQEPEQPHEIVMVDDETEHGEDNKEEIKNANNNGNEGSTPSQESVKIHSGKYESSESPYVKNPEDKDEESSSDSDEEVPRIYYQDKVSYDEAFGSLEKAKTIEEKIEVLEQIEDIVHHIEFGQLLMKTVEEFLPYLKHENSKIRALSAICIGSSLQNNPKARKIAVKHNLYDILVERLTNEEDGTVLKRLCYAFSNLVRGDIKMIKKIHESKGLQSLYQLYVNKPSIRSKLDTFITDIFDPEKMKEGTKLEEFLDKEGAQLWCTLFQQNILSNEGYIPDDLNSLSIMLEAGHCSTITSDVRRVLLDLPKTQPELFEDTLDLNDTIQKILNYQGPIVNPPNKESNKEI